jgi:hypothetical protein
MSSWIPTFSLAYLFIAEFMLLPACRLVSLNSNVVDYPARVIESQGELKIPAASFRNL